MDLRLAYDLGTELLEEHGLSGWRIVFDSAKARAGVCRSSRREIGLSRHLTLLHSEDLVRDTLLHEIAHALVGPGHGHDAVWRAAAKRIGCSGQRCVPSDAPRVSGAWSGQCPAGHGFTRHRVPTRVQSCRRCCAGFDPRYLIEWRLEGRSDISMHPRYAEEVLALVARHGRHVVALSPETLARAAERRLGLRGADRR